MSIEEGEEVQAKGIKITVNKIIAEKSQIPRKRWSSRHKKLLEN
jgi:hypothetical protein